MLRWLATLVLTAAAVLLLWRAYGAWQTRSGLQFQIAAEESRLSDLLAQRRHLQESKSAIEDWNALWNRVREAGIRPEQWVVNEIHTQGEASWPELERLLDFLSRRHPQDAGIRFKPEKISVTRPENNGGKPAGEETGVAGQSLFEVKVDGEFLVPRAPGN